VALQWAWPSTLKPTCFPIRKLVQAKQSLDPTQQSPLAIGQLWTQSSGRYRQDRVCPQPCPYQHLEDEDRDGLQNIGDSARELYYTWLLGKHQMLATIMICLQIHIIFCIGKIFILSAIKMQYISLGHPTRKIFTITVLIIFQIHFVHFLLYL